jgi:hypothetical protein
MHAILVKYVVRVIAYSYQGSGLEMPLASISGGRGRQAGARRSDPCRHHRPGTNVVITVIDDLDRFSAKKNHIFLKNNSMIY